MKTNKTPRLMPRGIADPTKAFGQCLWQSKLYAKKHNQGLIRVTGAEYGKREHWAIYTDIGQRFLYSYGLSGVIIDLTARQFDKNLPARYEDEASEWIDNACLWLGDNLNYELYLTSDSQAEPISWGYWELDNDEIELPKKMMGQWNISVLGSLTY
jgi:hypothetical protein